MTREEIEAKWNTMTAKERDAWVAEVVLGHSVMVLEGTSTYRETSGGQ